MNPLFIESNREYCTRIQANLGGREWSEALPEAGTGREGIHDWVRDGTQEEAQIRSE